MIHQQNIYGKDKVEVAIERLKTFEPPEGYYLAFSGGKDSVVLKALADMSGVKYDAYYSVTTVDHPKLVQFIKREHPDVIFEKAHDKEGKHITMWSLIIKKKLPPTRIARYCCEFLKEHGGEGRFTVTGVRWAESARRKNSRGGLEIENGSKKRIHADPDNPESERLARYCPTRGKHILNPIIDWTDDDIWEFIHEYDIPYCELYDEGYKRLGCIGCPMSTHQAEELDAYPKIKAIYIRTFQKMLDARGYDPTKKPPLWKDGEDVYEWWIGNSKKEDAEQIEMEL